MEYYENLRLPIEEKTILFQSFAGKKVAGESLFGLISLCKKYDDYRIIVAFDEFEKYKPELLIPYLDKIEFIKTYEKTLSARELSNGIKPNYTEEFSYHLATAKYLVSDVTFVPEFTKREEQVYFNLWHGTPLKTLGKSEKQVQGKSSNISNIQRNFFLADKIITNNDFNKYVYENDYMIKGELKRKNKVLVTPSYRNNIESILDDESYMDEERIVLAYTWDFDYIKNDELFRLFLKEFELKINRYNKEYQRDFVFYISIHYVMLNDELKRWMNENLKNIKYIDESVDLDYFVYKSYALITDFSSIMFDAGLKNTRVLLDHSNIDSYKEKRGIYEDIYNKIPYEKFNSTDEMLKGLYSKDDFNYDEFNSNFFENEGKFDFNSGWVEELLNYEKKETECKNVLIYPGSYQQNGITTTFKNTVKKLLNLGYDVTMWMPKFAHSQTKVFGIYDELKVQFPEHEIDILHSPTYFSVPEENVDIFIDNFKAKEKLSSDIFLDSLGLYYKSATGSKFDHFIHFSGYEWPIGLAPINDDVNKSIFIHNDMLKESKYKGNVQNEVIDFIYESFDHIIYVGEGLKNVLEEDERFLKLESKSSVVQNTIDVNFNKSNVDLDLTDLDENIKKILKNKDVFKILNIGRINTYQKNHLLLFKVFEEYKVKYDNDAVLFVVGGSKSHPDLMSDYHNECQELIENSKWSDDIYFLTNIDVRQLLNYVDYMLLPSFYEGEPVSTLEAASYGIPVGFSNIPQHTYQDSIFENSFLCEVNDASCFAKNISQTKGIKNGFDLNKEIKKSTDSLLKILIE